MFDVDDTALFTSPGFQWGTRTYGPAIVSAGVAVREEDLPTPEQRSQYREFWTKMNNGLDEYRVKKWIATELIVLHKPTAETKSSSSPSASSRAPKPYLLSSAESFLSPPTPPP